MAFREKLKPLLSDIRFWIVLFFLVRLIGITNPPLETTHNWRQCLTNMIARNFGETELNLLYPRIDMAGNQTGIIGSEFPFYNFLIYIFNTVFGYSHWYGRLINLFVSSLGIYFFSEVVKKIAGQRVAFFASFIFLFSIWFAYSRKIMPDTFSVSLVITGFWFLCRYAEKQHLVNLFFYFLFCALGMLCKIPALSMVAVSGVLIFAQQLNAAAKAAILLATAASVAVAGLWYFLWVPHLLETYHYQLYWTNSFAEGIGEILPVLPQYFQRFYFSAFHSFIAFACCLAGVFYIFKNEGFLLKCGLAVITAAFISFTIITGYTFVFHGYYIIPFVPVMAFAAGYAVSRMPARFAFIPVLLIAGESVANQYHDFFIREKEQYKLSLEKIMDTQVPENKLIIINGGKSPQEMYFAHRKGWTVDNEAVTVQELEKLKALGAAYLVINIKTFAGIDYYPLMYSDEHYAVYKLN
ncbi:MAG: ArnT family glycosyltransferase [Bacteroidia bacterium]